MTRCLRPGCEMMSDNIDGYCGFSCWEQDNCHEPDPLPLFERMTPYEEDYHIPQEVFHQKEEGNGYETVKLAA